MLLHGVTRGLAAYFLSRDAEKWPSMARIGVERLIAME